MDYNYDKLQSCDVFFSSDTNPFSVAPWIRLGEVGLWRMFDSKVPNHTGFIVEDLNNRLWAYEATPEGYERNSLRRYLTGNNKIIAIKRLPVFENVKNRLLATDILLDLEYENIKYPTLWQMITDFTTERKKKSKVGKKGGLYCSEANEFILNHFEASFDNFKTTPINPYDEYKSNYGYFVKDYII